MGDLLFPYYAQAPELNSTVDQMMMTLKVVSSFARNVEVQLSPNQQSGIYHWVMMEDDPQNRSLVDEIVKTWQVQKDNYVQHMMWWEGLKKPQSAVFGSYKAIQDWLVCSQAEPNKY